MEEELYEYIEDCLSCGNDVTALEYYLTGHPGAEDESDESFINTDRDQSIDIFENILPKYFKALDCDINLTILVKEDENLEQVNARNIKFFIQSKEEEYETDVVFNNHWKRWPVKVKKGTICYKYENECGLNVFTKCNIIRENDNLVIK
jgi:hypothetical protein